MDFRSTHMSTCLVERSLRAPDSLSNALIRLQVLQWCGSPTLDITFSMLIGYDFLLPALHPGDDQELGLLFENLCPSLGGEPHTDSSFFFIGSLLGGLSARQLPSARLMLIVWL